MSAKEHYSTTIKCDGSGCTEQRTGKDIVGIRKRLRSEGWVFRPRTEKRTNGQKTAFNPRGIWFATFDEDFCPAHKGATR